MKICLIGSSRFLAEYQRVNRELTLAGHVVYSIAVVSSAASVGSQENPITEDQKETLDLVHLRKILESDAVYLVSDSSGYYGDSTRRELKWAKIVQKPVYQGENTLEALCIADWPPRWKAANDLSDDDLPF